MTSSDAAAADTPAPPAASPHLAPRPTPRSARPRSTSAAVLSALTVVLGAYLVTVLGYFISSGQQSQALSQFGGFFALPALIAFVLLAVFNLLGATRAWLPALAGGLGAGIIGALLGSAVLLSASTGNIFASDVAVYLFGSLVGFNLLFVLSVAITSALLGPRVYGSIIGYRTVGRRSGERHVALVRIPASNLADGELTHIDRIPVNIELADQQWDNYCAALDAEGWETIEVPAAPEMADSVFIEDAVVMFGELAVITNPGAESRNAETVGAEQAVRELGGLAIERISAPGTLDGGDVLKIGKTVYVGRSLRTNAEGIRQLRALLAPHGYTVVAVPLTKALHLKTSVTALPDGTVIGWAPFVDHPELFDRFLAMPEEAGAAVVVLSPDTVLMSASAPRSAALIADLGYRVVTVDISEFEKLEGCVTCLSVRVR
ncbi:dimethylargininase [Microterricola pindariensis]|uniref:dimethylargininase n=1 Tax=Microterricola pindariensis TaxID=478010 RepID=UPI000CEC868E|nr:dimethylargininase [Microterricola pindariensis]